MMNRPKELELNFNREKKNGERGKNLPFFSHVRRPMNRFHGMPKHLFNLSIRLHIKLPRRPPTYGLGKTLSKSKREPSLSYLLWRDLNSAQCEKLPKILHILPCFYRRNLRVIFEVFQSNFGFGGLNSTVRCLVWLYEQKNWEIFTSSVQLHILKSGHFYRIFSHCAVGSEFQFVQVWFKSDEVSSYD